MKDINKFVELIKEDTKTFSSQNNLSKHTSTPRGTISTWLNAQPKNAPLYDVLQTYVSNIDVPIERKRLYYEYCGYPVPADLLIDVPKPIEQLNGFAGYQSEYTSEEIAIPVVGQVHAGQTIYADIDIEGFEYVLKKDITDADYHVFLRVKGDCMDRKNIVEGSLVLVAISSIVSDGNIVVVMVDDEVTIRQYKEKGNMVMFMPCSNNPVHEPIIFPKKSDKYRIYGVVTKIIINI